MVESVHVCGGEECRDRCTGGKSVEGANGTTFRVTTLAAKLRKVAIVLGWLVDILEMFWFGFNIGGVKIRDTYCRSAPAS